MLAISKVDPRKWIQPWDIQVTAGEWGRAYGVNASNSYGQLKKALECLSKQPMVLFKTGMDSGEYIPWSDKLSYHDGEGCVGISFAKDMRKYLAYAILEEDGFTEYKILSVGKLRSEYSIRMFEQLRAWKNTGVWITSVDDFRKRMGLEDKYPLYSDLRKWVIEPSVKSITKSSSYDVRYKPSKKEGRRITQLMFTFKEREQLDLF